MKTLFQTRYRKSRANRRNASALDLIAGYPDAEQIVVSRSLAVNEREIRRFWFDSDDLEIEQLGEHKITFLIVWINSLVDREAALDGVFEPLKEAQGIRSSDVDKIIRSSPVIRQKVFSEVNRYLSEGCIILFVEGMDECFAVDVSKTTGRSIGKPEFEPGLLGPQEAFTESLQTNILLIRRRIKSPRLKVIRRSFGTLSRTDIAILYVDGVMKREYLDELERRLSGIRIDGILDSQIIEEAIEDAPLSPFPTVQKTERPDKVASILLSGRMALIVDGTPIAIAVPTIFSTLLQAMEDYYAPFIVSLPIRMLRHVMFWISLLLPSVYVALLSFQQEMIPTRLLGTLMATHEGIPFPTVIEALIMETVFEALREAGIRLPKAVGQSVSIVGALVIGDAAVNAGIVSPGMVIIVSITGVCSFAIPSYNLALSARVLRFLMMICAGTFGLYGLTLAFMVVIIHLLSLRSFGVPYMAPAAPFIRSDMKDYLFRLPWWAMRRRPMTYEPVNPIQSGIPRPGPRQGGERH